MSTPALRSARFKHYPHFSYVVSSRPPFFFSSLGPFELKPRHVISQHSFLLRPRCGVRGCTNSSGLEAGPRGSCPSMHSQDNIDRVISQLLVCLLICKRLVLAQGSGEVLLFSKGKALWIGTRPRASHPGHPPKGPSGSWYQDKE